MKPVTLLPGDYHIETDAATGQQAICYTDAADVKFTAAGWPEKGAGLLNVTIDARPDGSIVLTPSFKNN